MTCGPLTRFILQILHHSNDETGGPMVGAPVLVLLRVLGC